MYRVIKSASGNSGLPKNLPNGFVAITYKDVCKKLNWDYDQSELDETIEQFEDYDLKYICEAIRRDNLQYLNPDCDDPFEMLYSVVQDEDGEYLVVTFSRGALRTYDGDFLE